MLVMNKLLYQTSAFTLHVKTEKKHTKITKCRISAPAWNEKFELPDGSYSISDIQDYFSYILKKHGENIDYLLIRKYANNMENKIKFKLKAGYYLEILTPEMIKLLESTKNKIIKNENGENVPHLEIFEVVLLVHCNIVNSDYRQYSRALLLLFLINHLVSY